MVRRCKTIRIGVLLCLTVALAAGCGGDAETSVRFPGPPPPAGPEVRGTVRMPNGRVAAIQALSLQRLAALVIAEVRALTGNVEPVGRNERVSLSFLRNDGLEERDLGVTFTDDTGSYLGLYLPDGLTIDGPGGRFLVSVGFGSSLTRAFVCSTVSPTDIDFNSEAAVRLILDEVNSNPLVRLEDFSALEICEIVQAIRDLPGVVPGTNAAQINANATAIAGNDARIRHLIQQAGGAAPTPTARTPLPTPTFTHTAPPAQTPTATPPAPTATATPPAPTPTSPLAPEATNTPRPSGVLIDVGTGAVNASNQVVIEITLFDNGNIVGGLQNDIVFRNTAVNLQNAARCVLNPALGPFPQGPGGPSCEDDVNIGPCKTLNRDLRNCGDSPLPQGCPAPDPTLGRFRAIIAATGTPNANRIPNGLLYTCTFDVVNRAQLPTVLDNMNIVVSDPLGERITPVGGSDGLATIGLSVASFASAGSRAIAVQDAASFPASGFLLIDNQLVGFSKDGNVLNLDAPLHKNADPGDTVFLAPAPEATPTRTPTSTPTAPPDTPTHTATLPSTPAPTPTDTPVTPGATPPPTATFTSPPTNTPVPPTNTPITPAPTSTPTFTPVPPSPTPTTAVGPAIHIGAVTGSAGIVVAVPVSLSRGAGVVVAASTDIVYNPSQVRPVLTGDTPECTIDPAIGTGTPANKSILAAVLPDSGDNEILRVGIIGFDNANPIPDGNLFTCNFRIAADATIGAKVLINLPGASNAAGNPVIMGGTPGTIQVVGGGASINIGSVTGSPGSTVVVPVILSDGAGLAAVSTDIAYDASQVRVVTTTEGPACTIDPAIGPGSAANKMLLLTVLDAGGNNRILRVGVIGFDNANPLPAGTLFTCRFRIEPGATPGTKTLANTPDGSNAAGARLPVGGIGGAVNVL